MANCCQLPSAINGGTLHKQCPQCPSKVHQMLLLSDVIVIDENMKS